MDINERCTALEDRNAELERSNKELGEFAVMAAHDLRQPLAQVVGYIQLLEDRYAAGLDADACSFIRLARDGASQMAKLVDNLLAYARVGGRSFKVDAGVDVNSIVAEAIASMQASAELEGAVVTADQLPVIHANKQYLKLVFQNLIGNALKFHGAALLRIHIWAESLPGETVFSVRDNGIGIAPEHHDRIFVAFQRLHANGAYAGTGLGLAICKKIVEAHGGRIWVESAECAGATFRFSLPTSQG